MCDANHWTIWANAADLDERYRHGDAHGIGRLSYGGDMARVVTCEECRESWIQFSPGTKTTVDFGFDFHIHLARCFQHANKEEKPRWEAAIDNPRTVFSLPKPRWRHLGETEEEADARCATRYALESERHRAREEEMKAEFGEDVYNLACNSVIGGTWCEWEDQMIAFLKGYMARGNQ